MLSPRKKTENCEPNQFTKTQNALSHIRKNAFNGQACYAERAHAQSGLLSMNRVLLYSANACVQVEKKTYRFSVFIVFFIFPRTYLLTEHLLQVSPASKCLGGLGSLNNSTRKKKQRYSLSL